MLFRWTGSSNVALLHRQGATQLADTFPMTSPFGSPLVDPCTAKEAGNLYGLCLKARDENSVPCLSHAVFFLDARRHVPAPGWGRQ